MALWCERGLRNCFRDTARGPGGSSLRSRPGFESTAVSLHLRPLKCDLRAGGDGTETGGGEQVRGYRVGRCHSRRPAPDSMGPPGVLSRSTWEPAGGGWRGPVRPSALPHRAVLPLLPEGVWVPEGEC